MLTSRRRFLQSGLSVAGLSLLPATASAAPQAAPTSAPQMTPARQRVPRVGFIKQPPLLDYMDAFHDGMQEHGWIDGQNYILEYRYVEDPSKMAETAEELAAIPVDLFVCPNGAALNAASRASSTIPIVFATFPNPVLTGTVQSMSRPGGRITGPSQIAPGMTGKRLQLLKEMAPGISRVGTFVQPENALVESQMLEIEEAAATLGLQIVPLETPQPSAFPDAFAVAVSAGVDSLFIPIFQVVMVNAPTIARFAIEQRLPALSFQSEYPRGGGLASYGASIPAQYRRAAYYVDRIVKGADPATLPIEQPTAWDFILNETAAQAIGFTFPQSILLQATAIIQ